jgi:hypothetical protein
MVPSLYPLAASPPDEIWDKGNALLDPVVIATSVSLGAERRTPKPHHLYIYRAIGRREVPADTLAARRHVLSSIMVTDIPAELSNQLQEQRYYAQWITVEMTLVHTASHDELVAILKVSVFQ